MTPQQESWFAKQDIFEAERIEEILHLLERLNLSYAMRSAILQQVPASDSTLESAIEFSSLAHITLARRYKQLTGKDYQAYIPRAKKRRRRTNGNKD